MSRNQIKELSPPAQFQNRYNLTAPVAGQRGAGLFWTAREEVRNATRRDSVFALMSFR